MQVLCARYPLMGFGSYGYGWILYTKSLIAIFEIPYGLGVRTIGGDCVFSCVKFTSKCSVETMSTPLLHAAEYASEILSLKCTACHFGVYLLTLASL